MTKQLFALCAIVAAGCALGAAAVLHQHDVRQFGITAGLPDAALQPRPASIVGVNVALEQYDDLEPVLANLDGITWLRQVFPWDLIEPAPGAYDWARWDAIVAEADAAGHELIAVLHFAPDWARAEGAGRSGPPALPASLAQFAGAFAGRYGDRIDVYQVWDEPNLLLGWGGLEPSATRYAALLQAAYDAIHAHDSTATVLAAALAPTLETGPDNVSDLLYLQQLYDLGAEAYFDGAAGKPYGFYTGPDDRRADPGLLNFSRFALLRQVMERNGDAHSLLWGGNFGWNTLTSPWGQATPEEQAAHTLSAYARAQQEWAWAGVLALENYQPDARADDLRWGFALVDAAGQPTNLLSALRAAAAPVPAVPGNYTAQHPAAEYVGAWAFSELGADIPEDYANAAVTFTFTGTDVALLVRRGDYRGHLYVEVDGEPANALPMDEHGAYLQLTAPERVPEVVGVPVARGLDPNRPHTLRIRPERGWGQWALVGFQVGVIRPATEVVLWVSSLLIVGAVAVMGAWHYGRRLAWGRAGRRALAVWNSLGTAGQVLATGAAGALLYLTSWLTWGQELVALYRRTGEALPIALTALTAGLFYFSPSLLLALVSLAALFVCLYLRPDLGLAFIALSIPFYLQYRLLWERGFSMVEVLTLLTLAAVLLHNLRPALQPAANGRPSLPWRLSGLDWAVLAYFVIATLSLLNAELKVYAIREYRLVMLEPVVFYLLVRSVRLDARGLWRVADFFVLGAAAVALLGLYQYGGCALLQNDLCRDIITAEGGVMRLRSVYGSPNNLGLYLGRALPVAAAAIALGPGGWRRAFHAAAAIVMGLAAALTFSKGALLLGIPAGLAVVAVAWLGRRAALLLAAAGGALLAALPLLLRVPRFASLLDFGSGTSFFRLRLFQAAWRMFLDHPWLGVGPDNFLYQYRSRYILPDAWQEPDLSHPHNIVLDFLTRVGFFGFVAGAWMIGGFWWMALRTWRRLSAAAGLPDRRALLALTAGLMGLVADMLAHGLVDHAFFLVDLSYAFFFALAGIQHIARLAQAAPEAVPAAVAAVRQPAQS